MSLISNVELVWWSPRKGSEPPRVETVRAALSAQAFPPARAEDIPINTAFRRAVSALADKDRKASFKADKDGTLYAQLDEVILDQGHITRKRLGAWQLEDGTASQSFALSIDVPAAQLTYTWGDVSAVLRSVMKEDGLGSYSPKPNGGIYFVPTSAPAFLERLERVCSECGLSLLRYTIPDNDAQRAEIATAIATAFGEEIGLHAQAIEGYSTDTRPGILENRRESMRATYDAMGRVRSLMNGRYEQMRADMAALLLRIAAIETAISEGAEQSAAMAQGAAGRRIVV